MLLNPIMLNAVDTLLKYLKSIPSFPFPLPYIRVTVSCLLTDFQSFFYQLFWYKYKACISYDYYELLLGKINVKFSIFLLKNLRK